MKYSILPRRRPAELTPPVWAGRSSTSNPSGIGSAIPASFAPEAKRKPKMHPQAQPYSNTVTWLSQTERDRKATTWQSSSSQVKTEYHRMQRALERFCPNTFVNFGTVSEWIEHRQYYLLEGTLQEKRRIAKLEDGIRLLEMGIPKVECFGGKIFDDNRSAVLAMETIWCSNYWMKYELADWPGKEEMRYEGDGRAQNRYGRFPCLPRYNPTYDPKYANCRLTYTYEFDKVGRVPNEEDILAPVDEIPEDDIPFLLNSDLVAALGTFDNNYYR